MTTKPVSLPSVTTPTPAEAVTVIRNAILAAAKQSASGKEDYPGQAFNIQQAAFHAVGKLDELRTALGRLSINAAYIEAV
jgi:hypothetical protein